MEFIDKVLDFFFKGGAEQHLIFGAASSVVGLLVVTLDYIHYLVKRKSFLNLSYNGAGLILVFLLWGLGAGLVGLLGGVAGIFQETNIACLSVGIGWPSMIPRLLESSTSKEETQPATKEGE
jgi:hypothetical protein